MSADTITHEFNLLPKQSAFFQCQEPEALFSGAFGCGKSLVLCVKLLSRALIPGAREALIRRTLKDVKATTLRTLLEGDGPMPPVLPKGTYDHNKSDGVIQIHGGGQILVVGLDADRDKAGSRIGSLNLTGAAIDQAEELTEQHWQTIGGRLRVYMRNGMPQQLYAVCNPGAPSHFLAQRFGLAARSKCAVGCWAVQTETTDNPHLPPTYLERISKFTGVMYKRMVKGLWVANEGAIYDRWDRNTHVAEFNRDLVKVSRWLIGVDDGTTNPFAALLAAIDDENRMHIAAERYARELTESEKIAQVQELCDIAGERPAIVVDPAAAGFKEALRRQGFTVINGDNEVLTGIAEVQQRMCPTAGGKPGLLIDGSCTNTIAETEAYEWDDRAKKDRPKKENDHAPDVVRYLCMNIRRPVSMLFERKDLANQSRRAEIAPDWTGWVYPEDQNHAACALQIGKADPAAAALSPDPDGELWIWGDIEHDATRFAPVHRHVVFGAMGVGAGVSYIVAANTVTRIITAELQVRNTTAEEFSKQLALLSLAFSFRRPDGRSEPATLGWWAKAQGGSILPELRKLRAQRLWTPVGGDGPGWNPSPEEFTAAATSVRGAIADDRLISSQEHLARDAMGYVWTANGTVAPMMLQDDTEKRGTHVDLLIVAAGVWEMLKTAPRPPSNQYVYAPDSQEARHAKRFAKARRAKAKGKG